MARCREQIWNLSSEELQQVQDHINERNKRDEKVLFTVPPSHAENNPAKFKKQLGDWVAGCVTRNEAAFTVHKAYCIRSVGMRTITHTHPPPQKKKH